MEAYPGWIGLEDDAEALGSEEITADYYGRTERGNLGQAASGRNDDIVFPTKIDDTSEEADLCDVVSDDVSRASAQARLRKMLSARVDGTLKAREPPVATAARSQAHV